MTFRVRVFLKHAGKMFTDKRGKFICIRWKYCSAAITPFLYAIYSCIKLCHACSCPFIISLCSKNLPIQIKSYTLSPSLLIVSYKLSWRTVISALDHFWSALIFLWAYLHFNPAHLVTLQTASVIIVLIQCANIFFTLKFLISSSSTVVWRKIFLIWLS